MIYKELNKFRNVTLDERDYKLRCGDTPLRSHSSLWKKNTNPFDEDYWSMFKALEASGFKVYPSENRRIGVKGHGVYELNDIPLLMHVSQQDIKDKWFIKRELGAAKGNFIHPYVQSKIRGRTIRSAYGSFVNSLDSISIIKFHNIIIKLKQQADNFVKDHDYLIPICSEKLIGSAKLKFGGIVDDILAEDESIWIVDYKTDEEIEKEKRNKCTGYLKGVDDCKFNKFRHQLSWYERVIKTETSLNVKGKYLVWFCEHNDNYQVIEVPYLQEIDNA